MIYEKTGLWEFPQNIFSELDMKRRKMQNPFLDWGKICQTFVRPPYYVLWPSVFTASVYLCMYPWFLTPGESQNSVNQSSGTF